MSRKEEILREVDCDSLEEFQEQVSMKQKEHEDRLTGGASDKILRKSKAALSKEEDLLKELMAILSSEDGPMTSDSTKELGSTTPPSSREDSVHTNGSDGAEPLPVTPDKCIPCVSQRSCASWEVVEASQDHSEDIKELDYIDPDSTCHTSSIIDLHKVVQGIKDHQRNSANCKNKAVAFVLGTTGAGKTTMLCWVLGRPPTIQKMRQEVSGRERVVEVMTVEDPPEGLEVGHDKFKSKTRHLRSYKDPQLELIWADTPGWGDTEGSEVDIANAVAIAHTMHSCQSVRPILLISAKALPNERGRYLRSLVSLVSRFITGDFKANMKSVQVLFTHVEKDHNSDDLWFLFGEFLNEEKSAEPEVVVFLKHVQGLLDEHKEKLLLRPTQCTPDEVKDLVWSTSPIENVEEVFGSPLSCGDREKLSIACDQLVQEVKDSLRDIDYAHLVKVLDTLQLLVKTSKVDIVNSAYQNAGSNVLHDFHGKLTAAIRNFDENSFESTRQQLEDISDELLVHTAELEKEKEKSSEEFQSIHRRREALVFKINSKVEQLKICSLPAHGEEDFREVHQKLDILLSLSSKLKSQLFRENQGAYGQSVKVVADRIIEYNQQAETLFLCDYLGFDTNLVSEHVRPSYSGDVKPLTYLATRLIGLRDASSAGRGHVEEKLLTLYEDSVRSLEAKLKGCKERLARELECLDASQHIDVQGSVAEFLAILLVPWATHYALADHVDKEFADLYPRCLDLLEEYEAESARAFNEFLGLYRFQAVSLNLRQLDVVRQACRQKMLIDRFKDRCARASQLAKGLATEIAKWIPEPGVPTTSEVFDRISRDLELLQEACAYLPPYLEDVRSSGIACKVEAQSNAVEAEDDLATSCLDNTELATLHKRFVEKLENRVKISLTSSAEALQTQQYQSVDEHLSLLEQMWPLHVRIPQMEEDYKRLAAQLQSHVCDLSKIATEESQPSNSNFDPARVKECLDLVEGLAKVLAAHEKGFLALSSNPRASSAEDSALASGLDEVREVVIRNIEERITKLEDGVQAKISGSPFQAPDEEISMLKSMICPLSAVLGERANDALRGSVSDVDHVLSSCELKFRAALTNENLTEAEQISSGTVQKMLLLQDCIPRVPGVFSQMQHELTMRKDCFVQKVSELVNHAMYDDLSAVMHGARQQHRTADDAKRWRDSIALLTAHFRAQYDGARTVLREVRMSSPVCLGGVNFSRVIDFMTTLHTIYKEDVDGRRLSELLSEYQVWCSNLGHENNALLARIVDVGKRSLNKWKFSDMERVRSDMKTLAQVPWEELSDSCEKALSSLDQDISKKVNSLKYDLSAMISYGYRGRVGGLGKSRLQPESEDEPSEEAEFFECEEGREEARCSKEPLKCTCNQCEFKCQVFPWRIDMMFDGLRAAIECSLQEDFDQIYERMLMHLDQRVGNLYNAVKVVLRQGNMEAAESLMHGAALLQSNSVTVSTKTVYNMEKHNKLIGELTYRKEEFITKSRARQDPEGFRQQLDELKDADYDVYRRRFEPLKNEILADRDRIEQQMLNMERDEDKLESVIIGLSNQYLYAKAISGHGDTELCFSSLLGGMKKVLRKVTQEASRVYALGQVQQVESISQFLLVAMENLKATQVPDLVKLAEALEPQHADLAEKMNEQVEKIRAGWKFVESFDICTDNPPVTHLIAYMRELHTNNTRIDAKDGSELSFKAAVAFVKQTVESLDLESLWSECMTPLHGGQDARLAIALTNLKSLSKDLPHIGMADVHKKLVNDVCAQAARLQNQTVAKFEHVQKSNLPDGEEKSEWKTINQMLEDSARAKRALARFHEIFPPEQEDKSVECMKKAVSDMHKDFCANHSDDIGSLVHHLVSVFKVASSVSNPAVGKHVHSVVESFLATLRREKSVDFGELATQLCGATAIGGQIVEEFDQFKQFKHELFKNKTAGMSFTHAMDQLVSLNRLPIDQQKRLRACWGLYERKYNSLLDSHMFRGPEGLYDEVKHGMHAYRNKDSNAPKIPELLAGICAAVSLNMSDLNTSAEASKVNRKSAMMHPHPVQVLALFRLLRVDHPPRSWASALYDGALTAAMQLVATGQKQPSEESHLIQISTGEGKSIVLGVLSIFLALCGYGVDCVCYSKYLSDRDHAAFKELFLGFDVDGLVQYGTFSQLARRHVNQDGDVRDGAKALVEGKLAEGSVRPSQSLEKILLIDEVDVFFSQDFYGALYRPSVLVQAEEITGLLTFIWENRGPGLTLQSVKASDAYSKVAACFCPLWERLIDSHIGAMIHATTTYNQPEHAYEVQEGRIGYVDHGTVNTTFRHGYNTTFCYFQEQLRGTISQAVFDEFMGLDLRCGSFSYAEIPLGYEKILGVTGTLESLGLFERGIIRDVYNVREATISPSMYGIRDSSFDKGVHIEFGKPQYHRKILDEITEMQDAERAVLVFFESEESLEEFRKSDYGQRLSNCSVVTSGTGEHIHHYVKQATGSKEVTLFPRVFGRGLDFVCYDKTVISRGGVAVVQTFLSEDISEEIQIKGRTCRQGEKGSYKMVLLGEDIVEWNEAKAKGSQRKSDRAVNAARAPFATQQELQALSGKSLYAVLDRKRQTWFTEQSQARQRVVYAAKEQHNKSTQFQQLVCNPQTAEQTALVGMLSDMNRGLAPCKQSHVVFCLDESGSMAGDPWTQLTQAFASFVQLCIDHGDGGDLISVIQFSNQVRLTFRQGSLEQARSFALQQQSGGTLFSPALNTALQLFQNTRSYAPMLVFMSDGANGDGDVTATLSQMASQFPNLQCHTIFFGRAQGQERLKQMAAAVPDGKFHLSVDGLELKRTFSSIAADVTAL